MAFAQMLHEVDPAKKIKDEIGDLSGLSLYHNQILVAVYQRPEKTKSGFILTSQTLGEDKHQSKIGLVLKKGPNAFVDSGEWVFSDPLQEGDWALFRPSDGWGCSINGVLCRILVDTSVKGKVAHPDLVW